ncbi:MAG: hypothetical protein EXQ85_03155 [Alphaproteobacteria bacterium]|nr:hypothetical protein [Alphaproteobacteria bacterium]
MSAEQLAKLLRDRRVLDQGVAAITGKGIEPGDVGRAIVSDVFAIAFALSGIGTFSGGILAGKTVAVRWYRAGEGNVELPSPLTDYLLVLRSGDDPWTIAEVCMFEAPAMIGRLRARGATISGTIGIRQADFEEARVYPAHASHLLPLSAEQRQKLGLFAR